VSWLPWFHKPEWRTFDPFLASLIGVIAILGVVFIASGSLSYGRPERLLASMPFKQTLFLCISAIAFLVILHIDYTVLARHAFVFYALGIGGLLLVRVVGLTESGGQRWIPLGPFRLQPSEFMKVGIILGLARLLQYYEGFDSIKGLVKPFLLVVVPMGLIVLQPDLGTALVCMPILMVMLVVAGARWRHLIQVACMGIMVAPVVFAYGLQRYQKLRIMAFLNQDELRNLEGPAYHLAQSKLAIGSGGLLGKGFGQSTVHVPVRTTDFIFTVAGEEGGLIGGLLVIGLFALLALCLIGVASRTRERFGLLVVAGAGGLIVFQSLVNMAMTMGYAPITGLTLPLVSYGGSSLLSTAVLLGLVVNIDMRRLRPFGDGRPVSGDGGTRGERAGLELAVERRP
jgi:rod shape determining protein RodA